MANHQLNRAWKSTCALTFLLSTLGLLDNAQAGPVLGAFTAGGDMWGKEANLKALEDYSGLPRNSLTAIAYGNNNSWSDNYSAWGWATGGYHDANSSRVVNWSIPLTVNGTSLADVANGNFDSYFTYAAQQIARYYPNAVIRIGWEMNLTNSVWTAVGHEKDYINAFRRVAGLFRGVSKGFQMDWCPNVGTQGVDPEKVYPGDDVVDIIGIDYYDDSWGSSQDRWNWNMSGDARGLAWHASFASSHGKRMSFPEFGMGKGGDDPYFVTQLYNWASSHNVAYMNVWDSNDAYPGEIHNGAYPKIGAEFKRTFTSFVSGSSAAPAPAPAASSAPSSSSGSGGTLVGSVVLKNWQTSLCVDNGGGNNNGQRVIQYQCDSQNMNQQWDLYKYSDSSYGLVSVASKKCMDLSGGSSNDGAAIQQYDCITGNVNQHFWIWSTKAGGHSISNIQSQKCLDSPYGNYDWGVGYSQYGCWEGPNQTFDVNFVWGSY